jgi:hypothetical protein
MDPAPERVAEKHELKNPKPEKHEEKHPSSIAELAYRLYEERGQKEGHQLEDWIEAERRISDKQESGERVLA